MLSRLAGPGIDEPALSMKKQFLRSPSLRSHTFAIVDTETTGMSPVHDQIIEIGIIRVEDGRIVREFRSLVRPGVRLPGFITSITGIGPEELENAPSFEEVALEVREMLDGAIVVAHNARFDYSFLKNEFRRIGISWNGKTLCTVRLSRALFPRERRHSLDEIVERFDISCAARHRAYDDALALWHFLRAIEDRVEESLIASAIESLLDSRTMPSGVDPALVRALPRSPGVYLMYDAENELLYIGKSVDIRTRVMSHFSSDHRSTKELRMCEKVARIEYRETSGELSALFLESKLIKELEPPYNRALRKTRSLALVTLVAGSYGYRSVDVAYHDEMPDDIGSVLAVFRTVRQAKEFLQEAVREHSLCPNALGLEKVRSECFQSQLGRCNGACAGREEPALYNARFDAAFEERRIKSWPFPGAIVVKEDPEALEGVAYIVDQWCVTGRMQYGEDGAAALDSHYARFDFDTYKILLRHLLKSSVRSSLMPYHQSLFASLDAAQEAVIS